MAGAGASLRLDYELELQRTIDAMREFARRGGDASPALAAIGEDMLRSTRQRFDDQVSPEGEPWEPLSERYRKRKPKRKDQILVLNTYLRDTIRYQADSDMLEIGTDRIYGASHQFGDEDRGIPERPFLGFSESDLDSATETLMAYLEEPFEETP